MASDHPGLDPSDTAELGELLTFLSDWLGSSDSAQLAASLSRFVATTCYELDELRLGPEPLRLPTRRGRRSAPLQHRPKLAADPTIATRALAHHPAR